MFKKIVSIALAAMMLGTTAIAASAAESEDAVAADDSSAAVGADASNEAGADGGEAAGDGSTIYFKVGDAGWKNYEFITFFVYEKESGTQLITWGSKKGRMEDMGDGATYSFDLAAAGITLDSGKNYGCNFTADWGSQTCDLMISTACYGDTAVAEAEKIENNVDSNKKSNKVRWTNTTSCGIPKCITSIGNVIGDTFWPGENAYDMFVKFLKSPGQDGLQNAKKYKPEMTEQQIIDNVASELGLGKDDVAKAVAEAKAAGVDINWSADSSSAPASSGGGTSSGSGSGSGTSSNSGSGSGTGTNSNSGSGTTGNSGSGTTGTSGSSSSSRSGSGSTGSVTSGQETTILFVFGGVMLAAAGIIFLGRKRREF